MQNLAGIIMKMEVYSDRHESFLPYNFASSWIYGRIHVKVLCLPFSCKRYGHNVTISGHNPLRLFLSLPIALTD